MLTRAATRPRRYLGLGTTIFFGVRLAGWESSWLAVVGFALGVAIVAIDVYERREKGADDPVTLNLHP